ncbi:MAG: glycosyltransferase [Usitatibacter sp.]
MDPKASILIVGSAAPTSLESSYLRAFREAGFSRSRMFDVSRYRPWAYASSLAAKLKARVQAAAAPHLVGRALARHLTLSCYDLVIVFKGQDLTREALLECRARSKGAKWANINPDDPFNPDRTASNDRVRACISEFDWYFIWSRRLVERLLVAGARCPLYLPFGYDPSLHAPCEEELEPSLVTFVGAWDPRRERQLARLAHFNLRIHGAAWERIATASPLAGRIGKGTLHGPGFARVVARSLLSLNLYRPQNAGAHNMRSFEIPAMRGCMLSDRSAEQDEFLPEGRGCLAFGSDDEMVDQVERALRFPGEALRIRTQARSLIEPHRYGARAACVLAAVGL